MSQQGARPDWWQTAPWCLSPQVHSRDASDNRDYVPPVLGDFGRARRATAPATHDKEEYA
jgi:hypothetical protein